MLIEFEVGNFYSFRDPMRLSLVAATPIKEHQDDNVFAAGRHRLLRSAAIYGANASGKSNLLQALVQMRWLVLNSSRETQAEDPIRVSPYLLDTGSENRPTRFDVRFFDDGVTYRYGFEADRQRIRGEWLFEARRLAEKPLFLRKDSDIEVTSRFVEGRDLETRTRDNALFLSVVAQFNGAISARVLAWFRRLVPLHGLGDRGIPHRSLAMLRDPTQRERLLAFVSPADPGIEGFEVHDEDMDPAELLRIMPGAFHEQLQQHLRPGQTEVRRTILTTKHAKFDEHARTGTVSLDFGRDASEGTKKLLYLAGPLLDCLDGGRVAIIDELEAKLHPVLTRAIVRLFNSRETNPKGAQLVFATHDVNLMVAGNLRRDQVWFVEKTQEGATDLYSLAEVKLPKGSKVRNDAAFAKNYLAGRYGAVPPLGELAQFFKERPDGQADQIQ